MRPGITITMKTTKENREKLSQMDWSKTLVQLGKKLVESQNINKANNYTQQTRSNSVQGDEVGDTVKDVGSHTPHLSSSVGTESVQEASA